MNHQPPFCQTHANHVTVADNGQKHDTDDDEEEETSSTGEEESQSSLPHKNGTLVTNSAYLSGGSSSQIEELRNDTGKEKSYFAATEDDRKREHKKRSKNWTRAETLKLIQARKELDEKFQKSGKKVALWDEISCYLHRENFSRDGQQCKDKWEKLTAGYKEVVGGARDKEDHPFYEELHPLLFWKSCGRENAAGDVMNKRVKFDLGDSSPAMHNWKAIGGVNDDIVSAMGMMNASKEGPVSPKTAAPEAPATDISAIQELLETLISRQHKFFKELLEAVERKEQQREQVRQEREEKWRAEERAQRYALDSTMMMLTRRLLGETAAMVTVTAPAQHSVPVAPPNISSEMSKSKKRSKNWKRSEVSCLIKLRREMESKFAKSTRRAGLWEELGEKLGALGIRRDGKQCREKWDKLMAEYKDVMDGRKDKEESPYFAQLHEFVRRTKESEAKEVTMATMKEENGVT